jgi:hypothetical protein
VLTGTLERYSIARFAAHPSILLLAPSCSPEANSWCSSFSREAFMQRLTSTLFALALVSPLAEAQECGSMQRIDHRYSPTQVAFDLTVKDISADGQMVIANGSAAIFSGVYQRPFVWSEANGLRMLSFDSSYSLDLTTISGNGLVVGGHGENSFGGSQFQHAYRDAPNGGFLDDTNFIDSRLLDLSFDGETAVGWSVPVSLPFRPLPFKWTQATGMVNLLTLPGGDEGQAQLISGDGTVAVGWSRDSVGTAFPVRWDATNTPTVLGPRDARGTAISSDGSVVLGTISSTGLPERPFLWTTAGGFSALTIPPGFTSAKGVNLNSAGTTAFVAAGTASGGAAILQYGVSTGYAPFYSGNADLPLASNTGIRVAQDGSAFAYNDLLWRRDTVGVFCAQDTAGSTCQPTLQSVGTPSLTSSMPFEIILGSAPTQSIGLVFYGSGRPARFSGLYGDFCVEGPLFRLPVVFAGGNPAQGSCVGEFRSDFNAYLGSGAAHGLLAGEHVVAQVWFRDAGAPGGGRFSDALAIPICD